MCFTLFESIFCEGTTIMGKFICYIIALSAIHKIDMFINEFDYILLYLILKLFGLKYAIKTFYLIKYELKSKIDDYI